MLYARILTTIDTIDGQVKKLKLEKKSDFAFYDLIYANKNGTSITEDTLKIRVYQKNEWNTKDVLVIRKCAVLTEGSKEDKVLLKEEFDTETEAIEFVEKHFGNDYAFSFKLEKNGSEYVNDNLRIWYENITGLGASVEFESASQDVIENAIQLFPVSERLQESVPEYMYKKINPSF